ncbi:tail tape measure protein, partial [Aurantiacibacter xanthus]
MNDDLEPLLVEVRASTSDFRADIESMRASVDSSLVGGFEKAGSVLERGLLGAIRRGSLGFDDLKQVALRA